MSSPFRARRAARGSYLRILLVLLLAAFLLSAASCGKSPAPSADSKPFEAAVAKYLDEHNMALAIKEVKAGPLVDGDTATMTASLTHAELGGASVTWEFTFEKGADGNWKVVGHED